MSTGADQTRRGGARRARLAPAGLAPAERDALNQRLLERIGAVQDARQAIVSSSKDSEAVLRAAGIADLLDAPVGGVLAHRMRLPRQAPAGHLPRMGSSARGGARPVGSGRGRAGWGRGRRQRVFGLAMGADREGEPEASKEAGVDLVVDDLGLLVPTEA